MTNYIMSPSLFQEMRQISGFNNMNGKTYSEHICIIFKDKLTDAQKQKIQEIEANEDALEYLGSIVKYTHKFNY